MHHLQDEQCDIHLSTTALTVKKVFIPYTVCKSLRIDLLNVL